MRLLFLLVFIGFQSHSQIISLENSEAWRNLSLDTVNNSLTIFFKDHYEVIDLASFKKRSYRLHLENADSELGYPHFKMNNHDYFVQPQGGLVYKIERDTFKRVDLSFNHNMQYGCSMFVYDDLIYKFGGYGLWSNRDFFTYYDEKAGEWEVQQPLRSKEIPEGLAAANHLLLADDFYIFGGNTIDRYNKRNKIKNNELWRFNFNSNKWSLLGTHDDIETNYYFNLPYEDKCLIIGPKSLILIDVLNNTKTVFEHSPVSAKILSIKNIHYANGKFYMILFDTSKTILSILDEQDFFGEEIEHTKFYKNNSYWFGLTFTWAAAIILIILGLWLGKKSLKKRGKISLLDNGMRYRNKFTEFDTESMAIIKLLLSKPYVPSNQILKIVEKEQYSTAHNERIKVQKISDINLKIATLLGRNETIISNFKAENDRRIRVYKINKQFFR
jgi:hypothetical protein